jgi:hypothetical protein
MAYVPKPTLIFCVDTETGGFNPSINALLTVGCAWLPATELGNPNPNVQSVEYKILQKPYNLVDTEDAKAPKATTDVFRDLAVPNVVTKSALGTNKINMNDHLYAEPAHLVDFKISEQLRTLASQYNIQLLGQNLKFDMRFLRRNLPHTYEHLQRLNVHHELRTLITAYNVAKSLNVADGYGKSTSLDNLRTALNWVSGGQTHSAAVDAVDTIKFYGRIMKELSAKLAMQEEPAPVAAPAPAVQQVTP